MNTRSHPVRRSTDDQTIKSPRQLYDLLPGKKEIIEFSQAQGANFHCQPTGRQLTHTQMLDWLADHLPSRQP